MTSTKRAGEGDPEDAPSGGNGAGCAREGRGGLGDARPGRGGEARASRTATRAELAGSPRGGAGRGAGGLQVRRQDAGGGRAPVGSAARAGRGEPRGRSSARLRGGAGGPTSARHVARAPGRRQRPAEERLGAREPAAGTEPEARRGRQGGARRVVLGSGVLTAEWGVAARGWSRGRPHGTRGVPGGDPAPARQVEEEKLGGTDTWLGGKRSTFPARGVCAAISAPPPAAIPVPARLPLSWSSELGPGRGEGNSARGGNSCPGTTNVHRRQLVPEWGTRDQLAEGARWGPAAGGLHAPPPPVWWNPAPACSPLRTRRTGDPAACRNGCGRLPTALLRD